MMSRPSHYDRHHSGGRITGVTNPLLIKIQRACRKTLHEPDLSLNLEIADLVNERQGAYPREACITLVKLINCRDLHTALFAIALLDVLVKNCGYPVHLQISRKEFLNELVRRFPDHPPVHYSNVQKLILTAIEEWYQTIAKHGENKKDMTYIRDMHRLLKFKGYNFPKIDPRDLAVLKPKRQLKTTKEIQREQDIKQAAKLEELIRRGTPEDLLEANKLMKVMAGFKQDNIIEAKKSMNHELNKLKNKSELFNELLNQKIQSNNGDADSNKIIDELYSILKTAQPKFAKIIEEEQEDDKLVQNVMAFNNKVDELLNRYILMKKGKTNLETTTNKIDAFSTCTDVRSSYDDNDNDNNSGAIAHEINLIDFDNEPSHSPSPLPSMLNGTASNPEDLIFDMSNTSKKESVPNDNLIDLLGDFNELNISKSVTTPQNFGMSGHIQLGTSTVAIPVVTNNTINGIIPDTSEDLLSLDQSNSSCRNSNSPEFQLSTDQGTIINKTNSRVSVNQSNNIKIDMIQTKLSADTLKVNLIVSNLTSSDVSNVTLSLAVPKSVSLKLETQSADHMSGNTIDGVTQVAILENISKSSSKPLKIKWKLNYIIDSITPIEETAVFSFPKI